MEANRSAGAGPRRWTYAEYARLPVSGSMRYEVVEDELVVTPSPTSRHQRIVGEFLATIHAFVREHDLGDVFPGPLDVLFGEGDYVQPDLVFVTKARLGLVSDRGIEGPPDLVIEVLSPSTAGRDRGVKLERYRRFGVPEYWVVDPEGRSIEVWDLGAGAEAPGVHGPQDVVVWRPPGADTPLALDVGKLVPPR